MRTYGRRFSQLAPPVVFSVIGLAILAIFVVRSAEASRAELPILGKVPEFSFVERNGETFSREQFKGKISIVDFFFTNCHGPCPTMSATFAEMYRDYAHSDKLQFVSFTVDPDEDSLPVLSAYAARFGVSDRRWLFVRGEAEEISGLCEKGFLVSGELPGMHSTKFVLVDANGMIRGYYDYDDPAQIKLLRTHAEILVRELP